MPTFLVKTRLNQLTGIGVNGYATLENPVNTGNAWRYKITMGWQNSTFWLNGTSYNTIFSATIGGVYWEGRYNGPLNIKPTSYLPMVSGSITIPYGRNLSGSLYCNLAFTINGYANGLAYGGSYSNGSFTTGETSPAVPIPAVPTLYVNSPASITHNSVYIGSSIWGNSSAMDYYRIGMYNASTGVWVTKSGMTEKYSDHINWNYTLTGLTPETYYQYIVCITDKNGNMVGGTGKAFNFTTLSDQASAYIKIGSSWTKGKVWIKQGSTWVKAKKVYHKTGGSWKVNV